MFFRQAINCDYLSDKKKERNKPFGDWRRMYACFPLVFCPLVGTLPTFFSGEIGQTVRLCNCNFTCIVWTQFCLLYTTLWFWASEWLFRFCHPIKLVMSILLNWLWYGSYWGRSCMWVKIPFFSLPNSSHALSISSFDSCSSGRCSSSESCWWYFSTQSFVFSARKISPRIGSFGGADLGKSSFGVWVNLYSSFSCSAE